MFTEEQHFFFNTPFYHAVWSAELRQCAFTLGSGAHLAVYKVLTKCRCAGEEPPSGWALAVSLQHCRPTWFCWHWLALDDLVLRGFTCFCQPQQTGLYFYFSLYSLLVFCANKVHLSVWLLRFILFTGLRSSFFQENEWFLLPCF